MTVRPAKIEVVNAPTSYASIVAGPGSLPSRDGVANAWRLIVIVVGGLLLLSAIIAQWR
jgi:hypothetical protein